MGRETESKYLERGCQGQVGAAVEGCMGMDGPG